MVKLVNEMSENGEYMGGVELILDFIEFIKNAI